MMQKASLLEVGNLFFKVSLLNWKLIVVIFFLKRACIILCMMEVVNVAFLY